MSIARGYDYEPPRSGGNYLTLKKGETIRIRLASEPIIFQEKTKFAEDPVVRAVWIVLHKEVVDGKAVVSAKHFKGGMMIYGLIRDLAMDQDWGDPTLYDIKVTRTEEQGKYYTVVAVPNCKPITAEQQAMIDAADYDLLALYGAKNSHSAYSGGGDEEIDNDPFAE